MKLSFHRARWIEIPPKDGATGPVRVFRLEVGVTAPVDPLSGMTVNLAVLDTWLGAVAHRRDFSEASLSALEKVRVELVNFAAGVGAELVRCACVEGTAVLEWTSSRGWRKGQVGEGLEVVAGGHSWPGSVVQWDDGFSRDWISRSGDWRISRQGPSGSSS